MYPALPTTSAAVPRPSAATAARVATAGAAPSAGPACRASAAAGNRGPGVAAISARVLARGDCGDRDLGAVREHARGQRDRRDVLHARHGRERPLGGRRHRQRGVHGVDHRIGAGLLPGRRDLAAGDRRPDQAAERDRGQHQDQGEGWQDRDQRAARGARQADVGDGAAGHPGRAQQPAGHQRVAAQRDDPGRDRDKHRRRAGQHVLARAGHALLTGHDEAARRGGDQRRLDDQPPDRRAALRGAAAGLAPPCWRPQPGRDDQRQPGQGGGQGQRGQPPRQGAGGAGGDDNRHGRRDDGGRDRDQRRGTQGRRGQLPPGRTPRAHQLELAAALLGQQQSAEHHQDDADGGQADHQQAEHPADRVALAGKGGQEPAQPGREGHLDRRVQAELAELAEAAGRQLALQPAALRGRQAGHDQRESPGQPDLAGVHAALRARAPRAVPRTSRPASTPAT